MALGQRIRQLRQSRGLTQQQLGGSELSKSFISLVERDRTKPSVETLTFIARRLGTSVDSLLGQEGHMPEMAAESLLALTREAIRQHDFAAVERLLETVQFMAEKYGLDEARRETGLLMAQVAIEQRRFTDASTSLATVGAACEKAGDWWRLGRAQVQMGWVKLRTREFPQAVKVLDQALATLRHARASRDPARSEALIALGGALIYLGRVEEARRRYGEAAKSDVAKHDPVIRGRALWGVGLAYRKTGDLPLAGTYLGQARDAFESVEDLADLMRVLHNLGQVHYEQREFKEALRYYHRALRVMDRLQKPVDQAAILTEIARVHYALQNSEDAEHFARTALEEAQRVGDPVEAAEAKLILARIRLAGRSVKAAGALLEEAVAAFQERGMQPRIVEVAREFAPVLRERGAHAMAADLLAMVVEQGEPVRPTEPSTANIPV